MGSLKKSPAIAYYAASQRTGWRNASRLPAGEHQIIQDLSTLSIETSEIASRKTAVQPFYKLTAHGLRSFGSNFPGSCLCYRGFHPAGTIREVHEPGFWHFSAQFWRRFVVSANLRNTCWQFYRGR